MKMNISNQGLTSLKGINLTGVTVLYCHNNKLKSLPEDLPDTLQELYCVFNRLTSLPDHLPDSLHTLFCGNNQLTSLPSSLPRSLKILDCSSNLLISLPESLPKSLRKIDLQNNINCKLPIIIPFKLKIFGIEYNKLRIYNKKRKCLGLKKVKEMPNEYEWDEINKNFKQLKHPLINELLE